MRKTFCTTFKKAFYLKNIKNLFLKTSNHILVQKFSILFGTGEYKLSSHSAYYPLPEPNSNGSLTTSECGYFHNFHMPTQAGCYLVMGNS